MNLDSVPYADADDSARYGARIDPTRTYVVKRGARKISGSPTDFPGGTRVRVGSYHDGRADGDGDVFAYEVQADGMIDESRDGGYVWAIDLVEESALPASATATVTEDDLAAAFVALGLDRAKAPAALKVAQAVAAARA